MAASRLSAIRCFFDPGAEVPRALPKKTLEDDLLAVFRAAGTPPEIVYTFMKTGMLLTQEGRDRYPPYSIAEWDAAIDEYFRLEAEKREAQKIRVFGNSESNPMTGARDSV